MNSDDQNVSTVLSCYNGFGGFHTRVPRVRCHAVSRCVSLCRGSGAFAVLSFTQVTGVTLWGTCLWMRVRAIKQEDYRSGLATYFVITVSLIWSIADSALLDRRTFSERFL